MPAHFENGEKCDGSKILASVDTIPVKSVPNMCRLEFRFQNLPAKNVPFSCERREAYPSHFSPFSKCAGW